MAENTPEIKRIQEWLDEIDELKNKAVKLTLEIQDKNREYEQTLERIKYCEESIRSGGVGG